MTEEKRSNRRFLILTGSASAALLAVMLVRAWFVVRNNVPPNAATVLGHPLPAEVTALGTSRFTGGWFSGLLGLNGDGLERAVIEVDEERFDKLRRDAGYTPFNGSSIWARHQSDPNWWDIPNLAGSPEYIMKRTEADGTASHHHVKYERGRAYVQRFFYAAR